MVYRILSLIFLMHSASDCVSVKTVEDMACPSVPQAAAATGYFVSGLKGPTIKNGARVYTCAAPEKLLSIEGGVVTELADGATIKCIPNSGLTVPCIDLLNPLTGVSDCPTRASLCTNTVYRDVMRVQCPRTCGFCTSSGTSTYSTSTSTTCVDLLNPLTGVSDCPERASLCASTVYRDLMRVQCPRTCGFCTSSGTSIKSTSASTTCVDLLNPLTGVSDCPARASLCTNTVYLDVMRVQCPRTCGFCTSSGTSTNSGLFVTDDGLAVGTKTFTCGEKLVPCQAVPRHTTGGIADAETDIIPPPTILSRHTIYQCKAPFARLFKVPNGDATMAVDLVAAIIKCKRQTGKIFLVEGATEKEIDPMGTDKYTCGQYSCQLCDQTKLVDPTAAACTTQKDFICMSKPTVTITANCPMLSCPAGQTMYLLQTSTTGIPVVEAQVKCDPISKSWLFDGTNPIAAAAPGFVCAATCKQQCDTPVVNAYTNMDAPIATITANPIAKQPTCTYACPASFSLTVSGLAHTSIVCNINTKKLTADTLTGTTVSAANKFTCATCACPNTPDALSDGAADLCPKDALCTNPTASTACVATCPNGAMAIYKDAGGALKTSPTIKCAGADWITAGKAAGGVACMFLPGTGFYPLQMTPPGTTACPAITPLSACPGTNCQSSELIYVQKGDGYFITCKTGSLVTDMAGTQLKSVCEGGAWTEGITQATCVQDATQVAACLAEMDPAVAAVVSHSCEMGACYISCSDPTKQFEYMVNNGAGPVIERNKLMKCYEMAPAPLNLQFTDGMTIKCV